MNIYWYWPHPHSRANPLALAMLRPGDSLVVQALPSFRGERFGGFSEYEVVRDLPDPTKPTTGKLSGLLRPVMIASRRSIARRRMFRRDIDLAHIEMLTYQTDWLELKCLRSKATIVSSVHDVIPHRLRYRASLRLLKEMYRSAGDLLVFHRTLAEELVSDFGVDPVRVHIVPHPLDGSDLRDFSIPSPPRPMVLLFGSMRANKGITVFLEAIRTIGDSLDIDYVIAGAGDDSVASEVVEFASSHPRVTARIDFIDEREKRRLFSQAACVVLPYTSFHSQSGVLADAYSYRVPLIVSDVGALGATVREDLTGVVVPPGDVIALAEGMAAVLGDTAEGFSERLSMAAHRHDFSVVGPELRSVYDRAERRQASSLPR